ncbi:MAG: tRNA-dihydrouridine synthase family protein [Desulfuromonadaceae bacterium]|nr:tRNA-dihydrouridine synthase family protein [Desulfuromonadaceae bacterium]MDD2847970.1 tRNA-dihydrouridine synthase family protein [Desulfuromonadaceae bacterium]MDD4131288.1 tRNA-dihydrouridine synthase family protein [Desulfuromonadaceae bacterium]
MTVLPWQAGTTPLMLAPMQGLTNRALRAYFVEHVRPDVIFTEFMRVNTAPAGAGLTAADLRDVATEQEGVPLVVQLVGHEREALVLAARVAQEVGAAHLNLNMGCPYGRMGGGQTGGGMLRCPDNIVEVIPALREVINGSFSVKIRAGYDDPEQILSLLPLFESSGVDFLVLHPRTVVQKYDGDADHEVTARVVRETRLPVIANGDVRNAADGIRLLDETGAAGLMLGRGAIADPSLFLRLRGQGDSGGGQEGRGMELGRYLREMLVRYGQLFCGDTQVLNKIKEIIAYLDEPELSKPLKEMRRAKTVRAFEAALHGFG